MPDAVLTRVEAAAAEYFEQPPTRASVSFLGVEPIEILRFPGVDAGTVWLLTLGMSVRPMGEGGPRAELAMLIRNPIGGGQVWRRLAVLAAAPVVESVVYSAGMSVDLGAPLDDISVCTGVLIAASPIPAVATPAGDVAILQAIPATSSELAYCRVRGAAALQARWQAEASDLLDLTRAGVALG